MLCCTTDQCVAPAHTVVNNVQNNLVTRACDPLGEGSRVTSDSGSIILLHIVDNCEECGQHNIVQSCHTACSEFFTVYTGC